MTLVGPFPVWKSSRMTISRTVILDKKMETIATFRIDPDRRGSWHRRSRSGYFAAQVMDDLEKNLIAINSPPRSRCSTKNCYPRKPSSFPHRNRLKDKYCASRRQDSVPRCYGTAPTHKNVWQCLKTTPNPIFVGPTLSGSKGKAEMKFSSTWPLCHQELKWIHRRRGSLGKISQKNRRGSTLRCGYRNEWQPYWHWSNVFEKKKRTLQKRMAPHAMGAER